MYSLSREATRATATFIALAPLQPDVPFEDQQWHAWTSPGVHSLSEQETAEPCHATSSGCFLDCARFVMKDSYNRKLLVRPAVVLALGLTTLSGAHEIPYRGSSGQHPSGSRTLTR